MINKSTFKQLLLLSAGMVAAFIVGCLYADCISVFSRENETASRLDMLRRTLLRLSMEGRSLPRSLSELVDSGELDAAYIKDAWGNCIEYSVDDEGMVRLLSHGDARARKICPGLEHTVDCGFYVPNPRPDRNPVEL